MRLIKHDEAGKSVKATKAHLGRMMARSAGLDSLARFAGNRSMRAWLNVLPRKLGAKAKQQLSHTNTLEPIGVPT